MEIFQYDFMIRAFLAGIATGIIAPVVGIFLVVRRYSHLADTLAHVSLAGIAVSATTGMHPLLASFSMTLIASLGIERLRQTKRMYGESVLSLFLSASIALAAILFSFQKGFAGSLMQFLFGSIATVSQTDVTVIIVLSLVALGIIVLLYEKFFLVSFDEDMARVSGLPAGVLNMLLMVIASVTIAVSMRIVGILLIGSLMVIPVITAFQFRRGFRQTLLLSVIFSLISVICGITTSYYFDLASGGAIVSFSILFFLLSTVWNSWLKLLR